MIAVLILSSLLAASPMEAEIRAVAALPGEPRIVSAAGVTRDETPILSLENPDALDPVATKRRLVLVGSAGGDGAEAVVAAVKWFKTSAPRSLRQQWTVSALPAASFEPADTQSLSRWITFQAPDLVVTVGRDPVPAPAPSSGTVEGTPYEPVLAADVVPSLQKLMTAARGRSPLHEALISRVKRPPIAVARVLAGRYPETPAISYIPALAWAQTLRLADITNDGSLREKVWRETRPWIAGEKKLFGDRVQLTAVAGTLIFADLAAGSAGRASRARGPDEPPAVLGTAGEQAAAQALADQGVLLAAAEKAPSVPEHGQGWTDDMFMAAAVLARSGVRPGHERDLDVAARLLIAYAARLQQPDGLFHHATDGPARLGARQRLRGARPDGDAHAAAGVASGTRQGAGDLSAADGRRDSAAGARRHVASGHRRRRRVPRGDGDGDADDRDGPRRPPRLARRVLSCRDPARVARTVRARRQTRARVIDVCTGTGAGPTRRYYFDRPAMTGADDRGGAMALLAALEMYELGKM